MESCLRLHQAGSGQSAILFRNEPRQQKIQAIAGSVFPPGMKIRMFADSSNDEMFRRRCCRKNSSREYDGNAPALKQAQLPTLRKYQLVLN